MNPNNCATCQHKQVWEGLGWCYMLKNEPTYRCLLHTAPKLNKIVPSSTNQP
jgi:hypothetical protein